MDSLHDVRKQLSERSTTTTLEELQNRGQKKVKVIRAKDIAEIVSAAVRNTIESSGLVAPEEVEALVERSREEFQSILQDRQDEAKRAREEAEELKKKLEAAPQAAAQAPGQPGAATAQGAAGAPDVTAALDKMAATLNERLEKMGKKMGISSAVEADEVNLDSLFNEDIETMESNMDSVEVKQKTGSGIAANLERLKKLKGGG